MQAYEFRNLYKNLGYEIKSIGTAIGKDYVLQYETDGKYKVMQSLTKNKFFGDCNIEYFKDYFIITCNKYEPITDLKWLNPEIDIIIQDCLLLYDEFHGLSYLNRIMAIDNILSKTTDNELLNALITVFTYSHDGKDPLRYYDFRMDNILWDPENNNYILWDVVQNR